MAKSILAGKTPLLEKEETAMDYSFLNPYEVTYKNVAELEGNVDIIFDGSAEIDPYAITVNSNEIVQFYAPQYTDITQYSNYIKMEYHFNTATKTKIPKNTNYKLESGEYIIFYYLSTTDESNIYEYHAYGMNTIINLTFDLAAGDSASQHIL